MASTAAYSGLRWGELIALTVAQVDQAAPAITVRAGCRRCHRVAHRHPVGC
jgi:integrase